MSLPAKLFVIVSVCVLAFVPADAGNNDPVSHAVVVPDRQPLSFEENQGQAPSQYHYIARGSQYTVLVNRESATLVVRSHESTNTVRLRLRGTQGGRRPQALERLITRTNYLIGDDPRGWKKNVPNYRSILYREIYPKVDLLYYGNQGHLEFDFALAPGADPRAIQLDVDGAKVAVTPNGDLALDVKGSEVILRRPAVYQWLGGRKRRIDARYAVIAGSQIDFTLGSYDHTRKLMIDPVLAYATLLGGGRLDEAFAVTVDSKGFTYVGGVTTSRNFPTTANAFDKTCGTDGLCNTFYSDAFVAKLTPHGTRVWVTYIGGGRYDEIHAIAVDATAHPYVTGFSQSPAFPHKDLSGTPALRGGSFAFVSRFRIDGTALQYSVRFCSSCLGQGLAVDSAGEAFVTGTVSPGPNLVTTSGALQPNPPACAPNAAQCDKTFVAKLNPTGTGLVYSTYLGGDAEQFGSALALDGSGDAYITGLTNSADFPTTSGAYQRTTSSFAAYISKLNSSGSGLVYSTLFSGPSSSDGLAVDSSGNAYISGTASQLPTTSGAFQQVVKGVDDAYVAKFDASGSNLLYATYLGGHDQFGGERALGIVVNSLGEASVTGLALSMDFPTTINAFQRVKRSSSNSGACFVTKLNASGSALSYSSYLDGSGNWDTVCNAIALGRNGNVYVAGRTSTSDFPTTPDAFMKTNTAGDMDAFAAQITPLCALQSVDLTVTICQPSSNSAVGSPVTIMAGTTDKLPVKLIEIFVDGTKVHQANLSAIMVRLPMVAGAHLVTVRAHDYVNQPFSASVNVSVGP